MGTEAKDTLFYINWGDGGNCYIIAPNRETAIDRMTEGEGMVNYVVQLDHLYKSMLKLGQAEEAKGGHNSISYLEGYQAAVKKLESPEVLEIAREELKKAELRGRREVVEWIEKISKAGQPSKFIPSSEWQAKLKEWGIEGERISLTPEWLQEFEEEAGY